MQSLIRQVIKDDKYWINKICSVLACLKYRDQMTIKTLIISIKHHQIINLLFM